MMTEAELLPIVIKFRRAFEEADLSIESVGREAHLRVGGFPDSACTDVCTVLGCYLTIEYGVFPLVEKCAQIMDGDTCDGTHHWLEHNNIIIDITANQFDYVKDPVIVSRSSAFHSEYAKEIFELTSTFTLVNEQEWTKIIYNEVVKHIR